MRGGDQVHHQGDRVGTLRAGGVLAVRRVEELAVECRAHVRGESGVLLRILPLAEQRRRPGQDGRIVVIERRGRERDGGQLRHAGWPRSDVIPVAEPVGHDVIGGAAAQVGHVGLEPVVVPPQQLQIPGELILLPGHQQEGAAPFGRIHESTGELHVLGRDVGHQPAGSLGIGHVIHHLREQSCQVKSVAQGRAVEMVLFEPA